MKKPNYAIGYALLIAAAVAAVVVVARNDFVPPASTAKAPETRAESQGSADNDEKTSGEADSNAGTSSPSENQLTSGSS